MAEHEVTIRVSFENPREAEVVFKSLKPEVAARVRGAKTTVKLSGNEVILAVASRDLKRVAAVTNSLLNLVRLSIFVQEAVRSGGGTS